MGAVSRLYDQVKALGLGAVAEELTEFGGLVHRGTVPDKEHFGADLPQQAPKEIYDAIGVVRLLTGVKDYFSLFADGAGHIEPVCHVAIDGDSGPMPAKRVGRAQEWAQQERSLVRVKELIAFFFCFFLVPAGSVISTAPRLVRRADNLWPWGAGA